MREKDWLVKVLEEASQRVQDLPDWKKSSELQNPEHSENGDNQRDDQRADRVAKASGGRTLQL